MTEQTRKMSFFEASINTASGFLISLLLMHILSIFFGYAPTWSESFWIVVIFTAVSILRNYFWRRVFQNNWWREMT